LGLQLTAVAKLMWCAVLVCACVCPDQCCSLVDDVRGARDMFRRAVQVLAVGYGDDHPMVTDLVVRARETEAEAASRSRQ
jgi:hypothetical protein